MIKLEKAATKIMAAIGTAVMLFLLFYSWKYTKRLVEPEYYLDEKDSILWNALVGVVLVAVCGALSGVMKKIPAWALHLLAVLGAVTAVILGIRLARAAGAESIADQYYVQRAAMALADGDAEWVLAQDYYGIYPFQLGLAEIFALIFRVAGSTERLVIQQVQAVCGGITLYVGFRIVRELSGSRAAELLYLVAELLFLPVYCYALFIYGELNYAWPGNVRELKNIIERMVIMSGSDQIRAEDLPFHSVWTPPLPGGEDGPTVDLKALTGQFELQFINRAYERFGNVRDAARSLGMDPATFVRKRKRYAQERLLQK